MKHYVCVDAVQGTLRRYESHEGVWFMTHEAIIGRPCDFAPSLVEEFRVNPDPDFYIHHGAPRDEPPTGGGGRGSPALLSEAA